MTYNELVQEIAKRVMKIDLENDNEFFAGCYDRDNGLGAAQRAVNALRRTGLTNPSELVSAHENGTLDSAHEVKSRLHEETVVSIAGSVVQINLGLSDVASVLAPAVDKAVQNQRINRN